MKKGIRLFVIVITPPAPGVFADKPTRVRVTATGRVALKAGTQAPDFNVKDLSGKNVTLADYKGKVVLINFWATWCEPCRQEIPWLIEMQDKYGPKGFTVLGLAM